MKNDWYWRNKERRLRKCHEWYQRNKERHHEMVRAWRKKNPNHDRDWIREWRKQNPEIAARQRRAYRQLKRAKDPCFKIIENVRRRIRTKLLRFRKGGNCKQGTVGLLGCSVAFYKAYLEQCFTPQMTWENYGSLWEIDHIRPCSSFDLMNPSDQRACFHFSNTRPLDKERNRRKWAKLP